MDGGRRDLLPLCCGSGYKSPHCPDNDGHFPHYTLRDDGVLSLHESVLAKVQHSLPILKFEKLFFLSFILFFFFPVSLEKWEKKKKTKTRHPDTFSTRTSQRGILSGPFLLVTPSTDGGYHA